MHENSEHSIKDFLAEKVNPISGQTEKSDNFVSIENLVKETMNKPLAGSEETVGDALDRLSESIKQFLDAAQNSDEMTHTHPTVELSNGFILDLICGTISFNFSSFQNKSDSDESVDQFINTLEDKRNKSIPTFKDVIEENAKPSSELKLQKEREQNNAIADEIKNTPAKLAEKYQDQQKASDESAKHEQNTPSEFQEFVAAAVEPPKQVKLQKEIEAENKSNNEVLKAIKGTRHELSGISQKLNQTLKESTKTENQASHCQSAIAGMDISANNLKALEEVNTEKKAAISSLQKLKAQNAELQTAHNPMDPAKVMSLLG